MSCNCETLARQELSHNGFLVLPRFFRDEELQAIQLDAERVLEAAGAYDKPEPPCTENLAKERGCVFEVLRPFQALASCNAAAAISHATSQLAKELHLPFPNTAAPGSTATQLPGLGLLTSQRLHNLVRLALGFPTASPRCLVCGAHKTSAAAGGGTTGDEEPGVALGGHPDEALADMSDGCRPTAAPPSPAPLLPAPWPDAIPAPLPESYAVQYREPAASGFEACVTVDPAPCMGARTGTETVAGAGGRARRTGAETGPNAVALNDGGHPLGAKTGAGMDDADGPYLFNEQFIIKAPRSTSRSAFGWHRDSDWCRRCLEYDYSPYISVWTALDEMTPENGALAVVPASHLTPDGVLSYGAAVPRPEGTAADDERAEAQRDRKRQRHGMCVMGCGGNNCQGGNGNSSGEASSAAANTDAACGVSGPTHLYVPAGTVVVFRDTLVHASGPNRSRHMRRAWMPQFSAHPIVRRRNAQAVALAVPLSVLTGESAR